MGILPSDINVFYECDPSKNTKCDREVYCYINGGGCRLTHLLEYAKDDSKSYTPDELIKAAVDELDQLYESEKATT